MPKDSEAVMMSSLVLAYLVNKDRKLAKKYQKITKAVPLSEDSPTLLDVVKYFQSKSRIKVELEPQASGSRDTAPAAQAIHGSHGDSSEEEDGGHPPQLKVYTPNLNSEEMKFDPHIASTSHGAQEDAEEEDDERPGRSVDQEGGEGNNGNRGGRGGRGGRARRGAGRGRDGGMRVRRHVREHGGVAVGRDGLQFSRRFSFSCRLD